MRLWLPHDPGQHVEVAAKRELVAAASRVYGPYPPRRDAGLSVRMRFLHELPAGPLEVRPPLPDTPRLLPLALLWSYALEGVLWADVAQVGELYLRREWARVAGLEVTL